MGGVGIVPLVASPCGRCVPSLASRFSARSARRRCLLGRWGGKVPPIRLAYHARAGRGSHAGFWSSAVPRRWKSRTRNTRAQDATRDTSTNGGTRAKEGAGLTMGTPRSSMTDSRVGSDRIMSRTLRSSTVRPWTVRARIRSTGFPAACPRGKRGGTSKTGFHIDWCESCRVAGNEDRFSGCHCWGQSRGRPALHSRRSTERRNTEDFGCGHLERGHERRFSPRPRRSEPA